MWVICVTVKVIYFTKENYESSVFEEERLRNFTSPMQIFTYDFHC
jgi:hypothetical protein